MVESLLAGKGRRLGRRAGPTVLAMLAAVLLEGSAALAHTAFRATSAQSSTAQAQPLSLAERLRQVTGRPEFKHATFGIEFYSLDRQKPVFTLNPEELFTPASTTKLLTEGTALALLGADYRFHTRVYRSGPLQPDGTLRGDLVLVASGDPNLSGRIQPDGTLAFENEDHCYGGSYDTRAVPGDPLAVLRELAHQVAARGVKRIDGRVLVDATLFPEGEAELGTGAIVSPIVVNDNIIDVTLAPGAAAGAPVKLQISPATAYAKFINQATTGAPDSKPDINFASDTASADGKRTVTITGTVPLGKPSILFNYDVPQPSRFAEIAFAQTLAEEGIGLTSASSTVTATPDFKKIASAYTAENLVAEHVSPPLSEEIKVTLKVSQNLHASLIPFLLGAVLAHDSKDPAAGGFDREHQWLEGAGLDLTQASQGDGAGGSQAAFFTPDFMVHYLAMMARRPDFPSFFKALPVLGHDGTLWNIQTTSPAAGKIFAKTGTYTAEDPLNRNLMVTGKGLAGYFTTPSGEHMAFAVYANRVAVPLDMDSVTRIVGQALGEIAADAYLASDAAAAPLYDVIIKNGRIIDGTGNPWFAADVGIRGDHVAAIGKLDGAQARRVIDAGGLVVAPGFIDMLGQSETSLLIDNRSLSKLSQGITSEITGEGGSIAPQDELTLLPIQPFLTHYHLKVDWNDLDGYFTRLEHDGTPLNLGTYVGAAQVREAVLGDVDRAPTAEELDRMKGLVEQAMRQGAMGLSTALIYPPGQYAKTDELIALAQVAARYGGIYATHMRSEGQGEMAALDEAFRIGHEAGLPVEIFHLKVSGKSRWGSMPKVVARIEAERAGGLNVAADMYPYVAGATALASCLPPWVADGGPAKLLERLRDPAVRKRIKLEMASDHPDWENLYYDSGGAAGVEISGVFNPALKKYDGMRVAEMARMEHKEPLEALFDFVLADNAQTGALYFIASDQDLEYGLRQPFTSIGLDANEMSLDGPLFEPHTHPRAFGSMPRFLGYWVRDHHLMPLEQAVRKITSLPAEREHLYERGLLRPGFYADVTVFDPATIRDTATYEHPASLSEGVDYVFVNGQLEFDHGQLTTAKAGRALRGPGWTGKNTELPQSPQ
ncbi:MAG TPA: D-alanyl-D-alanine carboxypeptidase/D-alanyl-D-alanine-endopeptidase [Terriglobia bacterium]|nr:D-alanyl-D-alanine carboxypeptidase/D-alanyl-D-alanine-endopeptidase [Terriglobia bacterium]